MEDNLERIRLCEESARVEMKYVVMRYDDNERE